MSNIVKSLMRSKDKFIERDIELFTNIENNQIIVEEIQSSENNFLQLPQLGLTTLPAIDPNKRMPSISEFSKVFTSLKLGSKILNDSFYEQAKTVYLYEFNESQINSLRREGLSLQYNDDKKVHTVSFPQTTIPKNYIYSNISYDTVFYADQVVKIILSSKDINIDNVNGKVNITSAFRGPVYQQHIRNTRGGRALSGGSPGERNLSTYPINIKIDNVAMPFTTQHNKKSALDLSHKTDYSSTNAIDNTIKIIEVFKNHGFNGFGIYPTHIHVDRRNSLAVWISSNDTLNKTLKEFDTSVKNLKSDIYEILSSI